VADGGNLASIETQEEQNTIENLADPNGAWIGLNDILSEGTAAWADGSPVSFTNWRNNQPNNAGMGQHCVWMRGANVADPGTWDDIVCNKNEAFACQKQKN